MERPFDYSKVKIIDQHCHILPGSSGPLSRDFFVRAMSLESYNPDYLVSDASLVEQYLKGSDAEKEKLGAKHGLRKIVENSFRSGETTLLFKEVLREFSSFLGCAKNASSVLEARNDRAKSNYNSFVKEMFSDVSLSTLILSDYPYLPFTEQEKFPAAQLKNKLVLPSAVFQCLDQSSTLEKAENNFVAMLEEYLGKKGFLGIKSMIAYGGVRRGSGLDIGKPDWSDADRDFDLYKEKKGQVLGPQIKNLQDYFHRAAIREAIKFQRPFEFHTGIGDTEVVTDRCNPMLLVNVLRDEELRHAQIILLHGGYPYVSEASWITHFFPNVYLDSSIIFFTHFRAAVKRMEEMLEMAPYSKLLYSSDGMIPELQWFNAKFAKRVISAAMHDLIEAKTLEEEEASDLVESYFHGNAEKLYSI